MFRSTLLAATATLMACAAVLCAASVFADLAISRPRLAMQGWQEGDAIGSHEARQYLLQRIAMAVAAQPRNADHVLELGRFHAWHASLHLRGSARHRLFSTRALEAFAGARTRRPSWGYAWVREAEQHAALGGDPDRGWQLLARADEMSPREPETQLKILWVGLRWWDELDEPARGRLRGAYTRLRPDPLYGPRAERIARHYARHELLDGLPRVDESHG